MQQDHNLRDDHIAIPRSEQSHTPPSASGHITGVKATSSGLIMATIGAAAVAGVILTVFWLPAEYGIDPTGVGRVLGLTQMGEIKQGLYAEAAAEDAALAAAKTPAATAIQNVPMISQRLDRIEAQLSLIATAIGIAPAVEGPTQMTPLAQTGSQVMPQAKPETSAAVAPAVTEPAISAWRDEVNYTLTPGEGIEIKLVMDEGAIADFAWSANGGALNYDTHGDGGGKQISYEKGRSIPDQEGKLTAAFTGNHGWFWRNRGSEDVVLTFLVRGEYSTLKLPN